MKTIMIQVTEDEYKKLAQHKIDCGCSWRSMLFDVIDENPEPRSPSRRPTKDEMAKLYLFDKNQKPETMNDLFGKGWKK